MPALGTKRFVIFLLLSMSCLAILHGKPIQEKYEVLFSTLIANFLA